MKQNILGILRENEQISIWLCQTGREKCERGAEKFFAVDRNNHKKIPINCFSHIEVVFESGSK